MIATLKGRLHTKLVTYILLTIVTVVFAANGGLVYAQMGLIAVIVGLIIEGILGVILDWQSGWVTFMVAIIEFLAIANVALVLGLAMPMSAALIYYLTAWSIIQLFLLYLFPVWRLSWNDNGQEIW